MFAITLQSSAYFSRQLEPPLIEVPGLVGEVTFFFRFPGVPPDRPGLGGAELGDAAGNLL